MDEWAIPLRRPQDAQEDVRRLNTELGNVKIERATVQDQLQQTRVQLLDAVANLDQEKQDVRLQARQTRELQHRLGQMECREARTSMRM